MDNEEDISPGVAYSDEAPPQSSDYLPPGLPYSDEGTPQSGPFDQAQAAPPIPPQIAFTRGPASPPLPPGTAGLVPYRIGRTDPITGQQSFVTGFGQRAKPPDPADAFWQRMKSLTAGMPIAATEEAVAAALRFQGQRQYQRDLASGMAPGEALARSAPLIFSHPRQGNIGQAASFMRATTKPPARFIDVGGVLYRQNADGSVTAMTPPKPVPPKVSSLDLKDFGDLQATRQRNLKAIDALEVHKQEQPSRAKAIQAQQNQLLSDNGMIEAQLRQIRAKYAEPGSQAAPQRPPGSKTARVKVRAPNGKTGTIPANQLEAAKAQGYSLVNGQ